MQVPGRPALAALSPTGEQAWVFVPYWIYSLDPVCRVEGVSILAGVAIGIVNAGEVFEAERRRLFGLACWLLGSASDAEDVLQTAFERWIAAEGSVGVP